MDTTRYFLGVLLVVSVFPAVVFWLIIHPMVGFWRKLGPKTTYLIVGALCSVLCAILYRFRSELLGADLGTNWLLILLGCAFYGSAARISVLTRRHLSTKTFVGLPELSGGESAGGLLQNGVYGRIRHPRYLSVILGTGGYAMFVNYVGGYLMVLGTIPALYLVVVFEERELSARFGAEYDRYRARVPAIFPGFKRKNRFPRDFTGC